MNDIEAQKMKKRLETVERQRNGYQKILSYAILKISDSAALKYISKRLKAMEGKDVL